MKTRFVLAALAAAAMAATVTGCGGGSDPACVDAAPGIVEQVRETLKPGYAIDGIRYVPDSEENGFFYLSGKITGMDSAAVWAVSTVDDPNRVGAIVSVGAVTKEVSRMGSAPRFQITDERAQAAEKCW